MHCFFTRSSFSASLSAVARAVAQPLRDLRLALGQGGRAVVGAAADAAGAVGRLVLGLARFAAYRLAGARPRRLA